MTKYPFQSKTITLNSLLAIAMWLPPVRAWVGSHQFGPEEIATIVVVMNLVLRFVTKGRIVVAK